MSSGPAFYPQPVQWTALPGTQDTSALQDLEAFRSIVLTKDFRNPEAYRIEISESRIEVEAGSEAAILYAWLHFQQWTAPHPQETPCGQLQDEPRFPVRGFMLDISRCKVPTRESLAQWVQWLHACRLNQFQLYTEHTFAYPDHATVWEQASPITPDDIDWLQNLCRQYAIELVPNQNCFGHFERWIKHGAYRKFAESPDGFMTPWGDRRSVGSVLKPDEASLNLVKGLLDELLPLFTSSQVNIGCDETFELGQGATKARCEVEGTEVVYTDFVRKIMQHVQTAHDRRPQFWADILISHPEMLQHLPKEAMALHWCYEGDHLFQDETKAIADTGLDFLICPGTSSWRTFAGRTENMVNNIRNARQGALKYGAKGMLLTDWGDSGHLQLEEVSMPPLAWFALSCWNPDGTWEEALAWADHALFEGIHGEASCWAKLGSVSETLGWCPVNSNAIFELFQYTESHRERIRDIPDNHLDEALELLEGLTPPVTHQEAWTQTVRNLRIGLLREKDRRQGSHEALKWEEQAISAHETLWRARNREGGLAESVSMYTKTRSL